MVSHVWLVLDLKVGHSKVCAGYNVIEPGFSDVESLEVFLEESRNHKDPKLASTQSQYIQEKREYGERQE
jgi:hypothetical protein